jgi:hypothetical protein
MYQVAYDDLENYEVVNQLCGQVSKKVNKSLDMVTNPGDKRVWFNIYSYRELIGSVPSLKEALDLYNKLP